MPQQFERDVTLPGGELRKVLANYYPDVQNGKVEGFFVHVTDVTRIHKLEADLISSQNRFTHFFDAAPDAQIILNVTGRITQVNKRALNLFGYNRVEVIGRSIDILLPKRYRDGYSPEWLSLLKSFDNEERVVEAFEISGVNKSGAEFPIEITVNRTQIDDEAFISAAIRDISERKKIEQDLGELAAIISSSSDAIISKDIKGNIQTWNKGAEKILGYTEAEVKGKHISLLFPSDLLHEESEIISQILNGENVDQYKTDRITKDGRRINVSITLSAIRDRHGNINGISKILRDITARKVAEDELKKSNEQNRIFVQQAPNAIAMFDNDMRYLAASRRWIDDYKLEGKDIIGKSHYEVFPEIGEDWKQIHRECLAGAINVCDAASFERADGSIQWIQWDVRPWYVADGKIGGLLMYTGDITEAKQLEAAGKEMQYILEKASEIAQIAAWKVDAVSGKLNWSRIGYDIFEFPHDMELTAQVVTSHFKDGKEKKVLQKAVEASTLFGTPYDLEVEITTGKGNTKWIRSIGEAEFKDGRCARRFGIFQDISKAKFTEARVQAVNEELRAILNSGHVSIIVTDTEGVITHFNRGAEQLLGYSAEELVGLSTPTIIHRSNEIIERGETLSQELGEKVEGFDVFMRMARLGAYEAREWTYVRKDGTEFPVQLVVTAVRNELNEVTGFVGVASDISELKQAELKTRALLDLSNEQNERLKNFAHIVSHNLRSHSGNLSMILDLYTAENPERNSNEYVKLLKKSAEGLAETITNLSEVVLINTSTKGRLTAVNLHERIEAVSNNVKALITEARLKVIDETDSQLNVQGLSAYIDSMVLNFLTNAIKYRSEERQPEIIFKTALEDGFVVLTIADNGLGIDLQKHREKLFGLYKTFHNHKDSRGVGLFITRNQVEAMGGKIDVESEPGVGTTFKIYLKHEGN